MDVGGVIMTKLDGHAKGGGAISAAMASGVVPFFVAGSTSAPLCSSSRAASTPLKGRRVAAAWPQEKEQIDPHAGGDGQASAHSWRAPDLETSHPRSRTYNLVPSVHRLAAGRFP